MYESRDLPHIHPLRRLNNNRFLSYDIFVFALLMVSINLNGISVLVVYLSRGDIYTWARRLLYIWFEFVVIRVRWAMFLFFFTFVFLFIAFDMVTLYTIINVIFSYTNLFWRNQNCLYMTRSKRVKKIKKKKINFSYAMLDSVALKIVQSKKKSVPRIHGGFLRF